MIIQLVTFPEEKAKQFIYQEDQKTQMKRIDSAAMNQYNPANTVVTKLNSDPNSNIRGMIVKNNGKIDPSWEMDDKHIRKLRQTENYQMPFPGTSSA